MALNATSTKTVGDIVRSRNFDPSIHVERKTILDGQVMTVGKVAKLNSSGKAVACASGAENEVQTIIFGAAMSGGTVILGFVTSTGAIVFVTATFNSNVTTTITDLNTAIAAKLGTGTCPVVTRGTSDAVWVVTYSGTGWAGLPQSMVSVGGSLTSVTTVSVARTTPGHASGGDATMISLTAASPSGADGEGDFIVRGPVAVAADQLTYPTAGETAARVALTALGIVCRDEPTLTEAW